MYYSNCVALKGVNVERQGIRELQLYGLGPTLTDRASVANNSQKSGLRYTSRTVGGRG